MNVTEEFIKVLLTVGGSYLFYRLKLRQPRLTYFTSGFASCQVGQQIVWVYQMTIQNTGKAPARNVRVAHHYMPAHWQVIQTVTYALEQVGGQNRIIRFDTIEPGMLVTIAYLDTNHQVITTAHDHVRSDDGVVRPTPVQLQRVFPKPVLYVLAVLMVVGAYAVVSFAYTFLRLLWIALATSVGSS